MAVDTMEIELENYYNNIIGDLKLEEQRMMRMVKVRLADGIDEEGWAEKKLKEVTAMKKQLIHAQRTPTAKLNQTINELFIEAYDQGFQRGMSGDFTELAISKLPRKVQLLNLERQQVLTDQRKKILRSTIDDYRDVIADTSQSILLGTKTPRQSLQSSLNKFADKGLTGFIDKKGRNWDLTTYTEMALRTTSYNAARMGIIDRVSNIPGMYEVIISSHGNCCPLCAPYEGQILSLSDNITSPMATGSLNEAMANGLFHPNCKHTMVGYVDGVTQVVEKPYDPEAYAATQEQRSNERHIRRWKKRHEVAITPEAKLQSKAKINAYQARQRGLLKDYESRTGKTLARRYDRESVHKLGKAGVEPGRVAPTKPKPKPVPKPKPKPVDQYPHQTQEEFWKGFPSKKKIQFADETHTKNIIKNLDDLNYYDFRDLRMFTRHYDYDYIDTIEKKVKMIDVSKNLQEETKRLATMKGKVITRVETKKQALKRLENIDLNDNTVAMIKKYKKETHGSSFRSLVRSSQPEAGGQGGEDLLMKLITDTFDPVRGNKPTRITNELYEKLAKDGEIEVWRGFGSKLDRIKAFDEGANYYGKGIYGNGTYTGITKNIATSYDSSKNLTNISSYLINPDAKFISLQDIRSLSTYLDTHYENVHGGPEGVLTKQALAVFGEEGRLAQMLGYDGIYLERNEYLIMLNRSKFLMRDTAASKYTKVGKPLRDTIFTYTGKK